VKKPKFVLILPWIILAAVTLALLIHQKRTWDHLPASTNTVPASGTYGP